MAKPHSILFVLITIFIDAMGFGLIMPVLPRLLMSVGDIDLSGAISIGAWMGFAMAVASFGAASILGNLSDRFGHRPILLASLACLAVDQLLLAVANTMPLIFAGRTLAGAFGGSFSTAQAAIPLQSLVQPSLMSMLSRRATPETQGEVQGIAAMAMGVGSIFAPLVLTQPMAYFTGPAAPVHFPGAAFLVSAAFGLLALILLRRLPRVMPA